MCDKIKNQLKIKTLSLHDIRTKKIIHISDRKTKHYIKLYHLLKCHNEF